MATVSADRAASTFPVQGGEGDGRLCVAYGVYEIASALSKADIVEFCKIPAKAVVVNGCLWGDQIETGGPTLEIDVGYSGATAAFLDSGTMPGTAVTDIKPVASIWYPFNMKDGPVTPSATAATTIIGTITAAATAGGTGTLYCMVEYYVP